MSIAINHDIAHAGVGVIRSAGCFVMAGFASVLFMGGQDKCVYRRNTPFKLAWVSYQRRPCVVRSRRAMRDAATADGTLQGLEVSN